MLAKKRLNLKFYFLASFGTTFLIWLLCGREVKMGVVLLIWHIAVCLNQGMLVVLIDELLRSSGRIYHWEILKKRKWNRLQNKKKFTGRAGGRYVLGLLNHQKGVVCSRSLRRKKRNRRNGLERKIRNIQEIQYHFNQSLKKNPWKILLLVLGKILILWTSISLSVQIVGNKLILPLVNYIMHIFILGISAKGIKTR